VSCLHCAIPELRGFVSELLGVVFALPILGVVFEQPGVEDEPLGVDFALPVLGVVFEHPGVEDEPLGVEDGLPGVEDELLGVEDDEDLWQKKSLSWMAWHSRAG
jgi:hypothetical protein